MRSNKIINEEINKFYRRKKRLNEVDFNNKTIINVDIQTEYKNYISFNLYEWVELLNNKNDENKIIFLFNGPELGYQSEDEYKMWLLDLGLNEETIVDSVFYDKGYAFFRYCMDEGIDDELIVDLIKFMIDNNINDTRDIDNDMWNTFTSKSKHNTESIRDLLEHASDMIYIPELMNFLKNENNIVLLGGGLNECLKEVEIALLALNKNYVVHNRFTY